MVFDTNIFNELIYKEMNVHRFDEVRMECGISYLQWELVGVLCDPIRLSQALTAIVFFRYSQLTPPLLIYTTPESYKM